MKTIVALILMIFGSQAAFAQATLTIQVGKVSQAKGDLLIAVYKGATGFPDQPEKAAALSKTAAVTGINTISFTGLTPGSYAVSVVHDVNGNGEVDFNSFGIPTEPLGFSNDPTLLGKPSYAETSFEVLEPLTTKAIKLKSFGFRKIRR